MIIYLSTVVTPSERLIIFGATADEIVYQLGVVIKTLDDICSIVCLWSINWYHPRIFCRFKQLSVIHYHIRLIYILFITSFIIKLDYEWWGDWIFWRRRLQTVYNFIAGNYMLFGNTQKKWQQTPSAMVTACEVDRLLVSIMKIVILYTFVKP